MCLRDGSSCSSARSIAVRCRHAEHVMICRWKNSKVHANWLRMQAITGRAQGCVLGNFGLTTLISMSDLPQSL